MSACVHVLAERVVTSAILINIPVAVWAEMTRDEIAERIDTTILLFFAFEIGVRIVCAIKRRDCPSMLVVDTMIVALALSGLPLMRVARFAHLSHVGHLRLHRVFV
ncbi:hypothetical protein A5787_22580 [Mycobacterium sp. 852002-50816_SCH5313054-b]|uniref:hypothetical protein n=1 Tax=Mycobacterium sp. 852002-50816_SCH5313054-b TaxID=1834092 RepID=UPI0007FE2336|nr:hypothetical protein [Mycobacterium sp. 852002-50816_SCH5313054-b]OBF58743.1 hypothetical protein A5787_22580 [Mycobacterium sp. 852002-50816_SCH5313054-b]